ncbi:hypothetical protein FRC18_001903 [Serendipita sp. 400]|nr:hypothetical protein FRC18_001903 [Serendipita sp. 400]
MLPSVMDVPPQHNASATAIIKQVCSSVSRNHQHKAAVLIAISLIGRTRSKPSASNLLQFFPLVLPYVLFKPNRPQIAQPLRINHASAHRHSQTRLHLVCNKRVLNN